MDYTAYCGGLERPPGAEDGQAGEEALLVRRAARASAPRAWSSFVEPSTSVKRKVTAPVGGRRAYGDAVTGPDAVPQVLAPDLSRLGSYAPLTGSGAYGYMWP